MDHSVFRSREFPLLDDHHKPVTYLDWTGAALPPASLIEQHCRYLSTKLLGNPHSAHHPSKAAMDDMDRTRAAVLTYFKADPSEYDVVFTSGATGAILLLQHFMFEGGELLLSADNHNSVTGLREVARRAGAKVRYLPITEGLGLDKEVGEKMLGFPVSRGRKLFCFPAKSNYSGVHHSLGWIATAQMLGWSVLLDAAAYLANERLDLSLVHPDFVPVSFYKLFGYPTGLGCLIVRKAAYESLHKRWFAGGSILLVAVAKDFYAQENDGHSRYEDGTQNFASMEAVRNGLAYLDRLDKTGYGLAHDSNRFSRHDHAVRLADDFVTGLLNIKGRNGSYGHYVIHSHRHSDIVTFSLRRRDGVFVDAWEVEAAAAAHQICFRTGCFCNPGVNERVFKYNVEDFERFQSTSRQQGDLTLERMLIRFTHSTNPMRI
jgi:selenocysteine lyase/cysteine desulfurase